MPDEIAPITAPVEYAVLVIAADCAVAMSDPAATPDPILDANKPPATGPTAESPANKNPPATAPAPTAAPTAAAAQIPVVIKATPENLVDFLRYLCESYSVVRKYTLRIEVLVH